MESGNFSIIVSPDESLGYLGFSTVTPPPPRLPFGRDNLKNISVKPFKFGMPRMLLFCDLDLQFDGHWWPLKGPVLIYRKLDHPMAGIYNTYICPL